MPDLVPGTAGGVVPCPWVAHSQSSKRAQNAGSMEEPIPKFHPMIPGPSKLGGGDILKLWMFYTRWKGYFKTFLQENCAPGMNCF